MSRLDLDDIRNRSTRHNADCHRDRVDLIEEVEWLQGKLAHARSGDEARKQAAENERLRAIIKRCQRDAEEHAEVCPAVHGSGQ